MNCICCNKLIIPKLKIKNLFRREVDLLCEYCYKKLNINIELSTLPTYNNIFYGLKLSNSYQYIKDIYYSKDIFDIYNMVDKLFRNYTLLHFDNEKTFLNTFEIIDEMSDILSKIIVIYH